MTVLELIKQLEAIEQNSDVFISTGFQEIKLQDVLTEEVQYIYEALVTKVILK